jgi:hypothetical protein
VPAAELVTDDGVAIEAHLDVGTLRKTRLVTHQRHLQASIRSVKQEVRMLCSPEGWKLVCHVHHVHK